MLLSSGKAGAVDANDLPVLVINTRLDHGPIPVSSMGREKGSLAPGLGSAVSTLQLETPDGELIDLPGTIFSKVALDGELQSSYVLEPGSRTADGPLVGSQSPLSQAVRRPMWLIWHMIAAPYLCTRSAICRK